MRPPTPIAQALPRVLDALAAEHPEDYVPPHDIAAATGLARRDVKTSVRHLLKAGHAEADAHGLWPLSVRLTGAGRAVQRRRGSRVLSGARA